MPTVLLQGSPTWSNQQKINKLCSISAELDQHKQANWNLELTS